MRRLPDWMRRELPVRSSLDTRGILRQNRLNTVCESALCPNRSECWSRRTATFMILGDTCTRRCGFCHIKTGKPTWNDPLEPARVARSVAKMGLRHAVVTSVDRDDLRDGGAAHFVECIRRVRELSPQTRIEAARALAELRQPEAIAPLFAALEDHSTIVRHWAEIGLERLGQNYVFFAP